MRRCVVGAMSLGLAIGFWTGCGKGSGPKAGARKPELAKTVQMARAELRPMVRAIAATGTLAAQEKSVLSAKVSGRLQSLLVDLGSVVREGDLLAQIEPRDYELRLQQAAGALAQARTAVGLAAEGEEDRIELEQVSAVRQARAVLEEASRNRERIQSLSQSGIASKSELDTVEAAYKVAVSRLDTALEEARARLAAVAQRRAEQELARKQLADASVRAPFDGAVQARPGHVGEYVAPGTPILELVKTDPLRLQLQVPERECPLVSVGQAVRLLVEGDTNVYRGQVARLSPALDEQSRMLLVEADVPARGSLRPGLFVRAQLIIDERQEGLSVPELALITFAGIEKVVGVQAGKAVEKVVVTGRRGADWVEILSGLSAGEPVILNPGGLHTGESVSVVSTNPIAAPVPAQVEKKAHPRAGMARGMVERFADGNVGARGRSGQGMEAVPGASCSRPEMSSPRSS